jgi:O-antigen ligase/polysaccharide polymerase Wzy-like membrane protein
LLYAVLWGDIVASYTRGFWLGAVLAAGLVLMLGAANWRRPAAIAATTLGLFLAAGVIGLAFGFSLNDYLFERASTIAQVPGEGSPRASGWGGGLFAIAALPPPQPLQSDKPPRTPAGGGPGRADTAGELSNKMREQQADVLLAKVRSRPVLGYGFGSIAREYRYGNSYSYELTYLDLMFKTGIVGLLLFLSFPVRLLFDGLRARLERVKPAPGVSPREASVVVAVVASILLIAATNPYLLAAFGLCPIVLSAAWLSESRVRL